MPAATSAAQICIISNISIGGSQDNLKLNFSFGSVEFYKDSFVASRVSQNTQLKTAASTEFTKLPN
jgi:hypothetical protein